MPLSPYACLVRPPRFQGGLLAHAHSVGGRRVLWSVLADLLREEAGRRASSTAEVHLLREWIADELPRTYAFWVRRLEGRDEYGAPEADDFSPGPHTAL